ncbi:unnamed protein product [Bursaphelenchus xylophilus]|uniref:(pine wood nematode) hypothetical protein n=1 Tax=Bursaphelenchus xylophilus TaxID=6326 RepID=A0A1I7RWB7_BURXY|nr:unnamed protein product [Bursaphelenchus xylophilus]CAG9095423.1 unnamed protein product [Bursaphelenchus xylophilus]
MENKGVMKEALPHRRGEQVKVPEVPFHNLILGAIREIAKKEPNKVAFVHYDNPTIPNITYSQVQEQCQKLSRFLTDEKLLHKGQISAICLPNSYHFAVYFLGVAAVGGVTTGFSHKAKPSDWIYQLNNSEARVLLTNKDVFGKMRRVFSQLKFLKVSIALQYPKVFIIFGPSSYWTHNRTKLLYNQKFG